ncbi:hypothetical protein O7605_21780 [Verrucosispora sp. WMMA2121]|uniref:hypothetical protein n=1 Tax=Verrucosispora sp. WMMA2121 TaxID=3015164 RepID=UPI0022B65720|nr:hypothetical protein [Verrucosispora sp. WMMA2121]MCZ7422128.1 hypothetical protein [Verrucosispora sp. WMMA2121]
MPNPAPEDTMPASRATVRAALSAILGLSIAGCGGIGKSADTGGATSATPPGITDPATVRPSETTAPRGEEMKIQITIIGY